MSKGKKTKNVVDSGKWDEGLIKEPLQDVSNYVINANKLYSTHKCVGPMEVLCNICSSR